MSIFLPVKDGFLRLALDFGNGEKVVSSKAMGSLGRVEVGRSSEVKVEFRYDNPVIYVNGNRFKGVPYGDTVFPKANINVGKFVQVC